MRTTVILTLVAATLAAGAVALRERARAEGLAAELAAARQATAVAKAARDRPSLAALGAALSSAMSAKRPEAPAKAAPSDAAPDQAKPFDDLSGDEQGGFFDEIDKFKAKQQKTLADIDAKAHLDEAQRRVLHERLEQMNERLGTALDRLLLLVSQKDTPPPRKFVDALADGFGALRDADDGFRASLSDAQRATLDQEGFDLVAQLDPTVLITRALTLAASPGGTGLSIGVHAE